MEKLQEQKLIKVKTVDHHLVVERCPTEADEPAPAITSSQDREEALPALQETLIAYVDLLEMGIPEREVEALMRASDPDFDEQDYGFQEFGELLNLARDKGLVRIEADASETLRYYPGPDLNDPLTPIGPPAGGRTAKPAAKAARPARIAASGPNDRDRGEGDRGDREEGSGRRGRRRRRRRGGRGRGEGQGRTDEPGPAGLPPADFGEDDELEAARPGRAAASAAEERQPEPARESPAKVASEDEAAGEKPDAEAKPAPRKAAKKKTARKKAARKKAAKKAAAKDADDAEDDE
jgi:hypothetical protein